MHLSYKRCFVVVISFLLVVLAYYIQCRSKICHNSNSLNDKYDYIIVGAGTAGCILAAKLSENSNRTVLLIEAGSEFNRISKIPPLSPLLQGTSFDWGYLSTPQKWSSKGMIDKKQKIPRGKGFGGTSQINFMVHGYLETEDLEKWEKLGIKDIKKYLPKFYNNLYNTSHNIKRANQILTEEMKWSLGIVLEKAVKECGALSLTFCKSFSTIYKGNRWTSYDSHLKGALKRPNLHVICSTEVTKVLISNKSAFGIESVSGGLIRTYTAKEIILAAGSINSPKLLMLSGVGDKKLLQKLNINVVEDLKGVGKNLHDHFNFPLYVSIEKPISLSLSKILSFKEIFNYLFYKKGVLAKSPIAGVAYAPSNFSIILSAFGSTNEHIFKLIGNYKSEIFQKMFPFSNDFSKEGFVFLTTCAQPKSRGYIILKSNNYKTAPIINPNYLEHKYDIECTKKAVKVLKKLIDTKPFQKIGAKIHWPYIEECSQWRDEQGNNTENFLECLIRFCSMTWYHPAGTCAMGGQNDSNAVLDSFFRVNSIKNLRIVDGSVLPTPVSTFPNSIIAALADYASEIIQLTYPESE
ncbi:neither inactivation nor afterpotential protein G-like isoform X2 [Agrilus planipennis]|uniref:Neither inactivation nor afterpotential protein G-like isoform X2 n=1 Tax=Agrilus planipennis TaxID=224129 RepID=A0A7F5R937_AGRPL|nr:neither inactivation nor afterpotential protein G-like isoform X2 [Agrilus planipennis]